MGQALVDQAEDASAKGYTDEAKSLFLRAARQHMGNPGAEEILYQWIDNAVAGKPRP